MAPVISMLSPASGPAAGGTTVTVTGTGFSGAFSVHFGSGSAAGFTVLSDTQITATAPAHAAGPVQVTVTTSGGTSNGVTYTYVAAPVVSSLSPDQGPTAGGITVTLTGTGLTGATAVSFGASPATGFTVLSDTQITATAPAHTAGAVPVTVQTPGGTSDPVYFFSITAPVVDGINPTAGPTVGGNSVVISGSSLTLTDTVLFGAAPATFTVVDDDHVTATAPPGPAGPVQVAVSTPGGTGDGVTYMYVPAPDITVLNPGSGPLTGGETVTVTGTGLGRADAVFFGAAPASFVVASDTLLTAISPPGAAGPVQVTVHTPGGTSNGLTYTYVAPPVIT